MNAFSTLKVAPTGREAIVRRLCKLAKGPSHFDLPRNCRPGKARFKSYQVLGLEEVLTLRF